MWLDRDAQKIRIEDEVAEVGHDAWSTTFKPNVALVENDVIVDCPGLAGDTRGAVVDVANGAIVRTVVEAAQTVRLLVLAPFHDVNENRAQGIKSVVHFVSQIVDVATIDTSILMGLSKVPRSDLWGELNPDRIRRAIGEGANASVIPDEAERRLAEHLASNWFAYEPFESDDRPDFYATSGVILDRCRQLRPFCGAFRTAIVEESMLQCLDWCQELEARTQRAMSDGNPDLAASEIRALARLSRIGDTRLHDARRRIFERTHEWLRQLQRGDLKKSIAVTKAFARAICGDRFGGLESLHAAAQNALCEAFEVFASQTCALAETAADKASKEASIADKEYNEMKAHLLKTATSMINQGFTDHKRADDACRALSWLKCLGLSRDVGVDRRCHDELRKLYESVGDCSFQRPRLSIR